MKKVFLACAIIASGPLLGGCATVLNGVHQDLPFQSDPHGATIRLVSGQSCETPCQLEMRRGRDSMVTFTREGYEPATVLIQSRTGGSVAGNILAGGIIGGIVDGSNGAANRLYPNPVYVRLAPLGSGRPAELLDKNGQVISTVDVYNASVETDVMDGLRGQGLAPTGATTPRP